MFVIIPNSNYRQQIEVFIYDRFIPFSRVGRSCLFCADYTFFVQFKQNFLRSYENEHTKTKRHDVLRVIKNMDHFSEEYASLFRMYVLSMLPNDC